MLQEVLQVSYKPVKGKWNDVAESVKLLNR